MIASEPTDTLALVPFLCAAGSKDASNTSGSAHPAWICFGDMFLQSAGNLINRCNLGHVRVHMALQLCESAPQCAGCATDAAAANFRPFPSCVQCGDEGSR
uniref:Uncharacterized protein n=1 Tax=Physcomitrium patens TaxID=3218 RepID=A0A2K1K1U2_PHYPA|nr:hypothetical protein PHYPA_012221 [Physcomitrium patens]